MLTDKVWDIESNISMATEEVMVPHVASLAIKLVSDLFLNQRSYLWRSHGATVGSARFEAFCGIIVVDSSSSLPLDWVR